MLLLLLLTAATKDAAAAAQIVGANNVNVLATAAGRGWCQLSSR